MTPPPSTQDSIEALPSRLAAEQAWNEANRAKKITSLRKGNAKARLEKLEQDIKQANENGTLSGSTQSILGDLARKLAKAMVRQEEAEAQDKQAAKELKIATKAWAPWANAEAESEDAPRIPRVAHLMEAHRRSTAPKSTPSSPDAQAAAVLEKPLAGLKAMQAGATKAGVNVGQPKPKAKAPAKATKSKAK